MKFEPFLLLMIVAFAVTARAQEPSPRQEADDPQQVVTNDDGGRAFIVKATAFSLSGIVKPAGRIITEIKQYSIFLGSGWADADLRAREPQLTSLLANVRDRAQMALIENLGITNRFAATFNQEKLDILGHRNINDLEIQKVLAGMFKDATLQPPRGGAIYVVFLDPDLHSTLGALVAEKHYQAYHAFFNTSGARVHYVVVPFQPDVQSARQIALRAFLVAAANPRDTSLQNHTR